MVSLADIHISRGYEPEDGGDEDLSYLSMEAVFTAPGIGMDERRMQVRAYNHWLGMVENGELPAIEELRPEEIADFGPNGVLVDLTLGIDRPAIVYLGERLSEECGQDREIFALGDVPDRSLLSRITEHCFEVVATRSPVGFDAEFESRSGSWICYRSILLPYSSNGETVDFVFGVISWKEGAATAAESIERDVQDPVGVATNLDLPGLLAVARSAAASARQVEVRSHDALYLAISISYDILLEARKDAADFERMVRIAPDASGAPLRMARLVFGSGYDKTRLAEIAAVLSLARRQGLKRGSLRSLLAATPGGLKALVAAERRFRRSGSAFAVERNLSPALASRLRLAVAMPAESLSAEAGEFALLVARRNRGGSLDLLGAAGADGRLFERAAKRLLTR